MKSLAHLPLILALALPVFAEETKAPPNPETKTLVWPDGTRYEGGVVNGKRNGTGTIYWTDGTRFVGTFKNDLREGTGSMILPDGTVYNGLFENDRLVSQTETPKPATTVATQETTPPPQAVMLAERVVTMNDAIRTEVSAMVDMWSGAWSGQNVDQYLAYYSADFEVPNRQSRSAWEAQRRSRITRPGFIKLDIEYNDFELVEPDVVDVTFNQAYTSDGYSDNTRKTLRLRKEGQFWKILQERSS